MLSLFALLPSALVPEAAFQNYHGKISLVQATGAGTRFFIREQNLSLYASGDHQSLLVQVFFRKANASIGYIKVTCTGGITGVCGNVVSVSVDVTNLPL
jgi:hypothetical protein